MFQQPFLKSKFIVTQKSNRKVIFKKPCLSTAEWFAIRRTISFRAETDNREDTRDPRRTSSGTARGSSPTPRCWTPFPPGQPGRRSRTGCRILPRATRRLWTSPRRARGAASPEWKEEGRGKRKFALC